MTYETLNPDDIREATAQTHVFWGGQRTREQHMQRTLDAMAQLGDKLRYVGLRDESGALVASLKFYTVALQTPQGIGKTLGVGAVFVPDEQRGKGYGQAVVKAAMEDAKALGYDAALLYSDIAPQFYARLGYVEFSALDWSADTTALPAAAPLTMRPATDDDAERILAWYHTDAAAADIFPSRTLQLWKFGCWFNHTERHLILCDSEREVGYVSIRREPQGLRLFECVAPDVEPSRVWAAVRRLAESEQHARVFGWLRPDRREAWMNVASRPDAIPMIAPLNDALMVTADMTAFFGAIDHF